MTSVIQCAVRPFAWLSFDYVLFVGRFNFPRSFRCRHRLIDDGRHYRWPRRPLSKERDQEWNAKITDVSHATGETVERRVPQPCLENNESSRDDEEQCENPRDGICNQIIGLGEVGDGHLGYQPKQYCWHRKIEQSQLGWSSLNQSPGYRLCV
jgi:hypothetical protein